MFHKNPVFEVEVWKEEEYYIAQCKRPDVASQGKTVREALSNVAEAISIVLEEEGICGVLSKHLQESWGSFAVSVDIIEPAGQHDIYLPSTILTV